MKEEAACRRRGVDRLVENDEVDAQRLEFATKGREVMHAAGEPVELDHRDSVESPPPRVAHHFIERGPPVFGTGDAVVDVLLNDLKSPRFCVAAKGISLNLGALFKRRDATIERESLHDAPRLARLSRLSPSTQFPLTQQNRRDKKFMSVRKKHMGGRPKGSGAPPELVRRNRVAVTLTDAELAQLQEIAEEQGEPISTAAYQILARTLRRRR